MSAACKHVVLMIDNGARAIMHGGKFRINKKASYIGIQYNVLAGDPKRDFSFLCRFGFPFEQ